MRQDNIYNRMQNIKVGILFFIDISLTQFKYVKWCLNYLINVQQDENNNYMSRKMTAVTANK